MPRPCDLRPTVDGRKGAVYVLHEGRMRRMTRNDLLRGRMPGGGTVPDDAIVVTGVDGHVRTQDVLRHGSGLHVTTFGRARGGVGLRRAREETAAQRAETLRAIVGATAAQVARLGGWPAHITPDSLTARIPGPGREEASGFDAGLGIALGMFPEGRERLAARLHAAYTPEAVGQVRHEMGLDGGGMTPDADSESTWWLAACSVCREGGVDAEALEEQLQDFALLAADPEQRLQAADGMLQRMLATFEVRDGIPWAVRDGGMQGSYLAGHEVAVQYASAHDLYFVGTFRTEGFDLEGFEWAEPDADGRQGRSGPVFGSRQFVKARDERELADLLYHLRRTGQVTDAAP